MLTILQSILEAFLNLPTFVLYAIESVINLIFTAIEGLFLIASALIPLPEEPAPPEFISAINWFFPVGAVISIALPIMAGYVAFLLIRWIYKWVGAL